MDNTSSTVTLGYRVFTSYRQDTWINSVGDRIPFYADDQPPVCTQPEAYRRISVYLTHNPNADVPIVVAVTRPLTPMEKASKELSGLLQSLCQRNGLDLGLTQEQLEKQIAKELAELGAKGSSVFGALGR